jgi:hypothetical protein
MSLLHVRSRVVFTVQDYRWKKCLSSGGPGEVIVKIAHPGLRQRFKRLFGAPLFWGENRAAYVERLLSRP